MGIEWKISCPCGSLWCRCRPMRPNHIIYLCLFFLICYVPSIFIHNYGFQGILLAVFIFLFLLKILLAFQFLKRISPGTSIGVKKMGKLDYMPFHNATKNKYSRDEAEDKAFELWSLWKDNIRHQSWQPFKIATIEGCIEVWNILYVLT